MRQIFSFAVASLLVCGAVAVSSSCGTAELEGFDCPDPGHLLEGVVIKCKDTQVVGTLKRVEVDIPCTATQTTDCRISDGLVAVDPAKIDAAKILEGTSIAGVGGTFKQAANCQANRAVGCLTVAAFPAIEASRLEQCLQ